MSDNFRFIGKSSGKILRSIALGKPVIASKFKSLKYIEDNKFGILVSHPNEISEAIKSIISNQKMYNENCNENYNKISFEKYWKKIPEIYR